jgi:predicted ester cyclase
MMRRQRGFRPQGADVHTLNFAGAHTPQTAQEEANERLIRQLYATAEGASKDTPRFVSFFSDDGYFYDVSGGKRYYGQDVGYPVDLYAAAFPDIHRELYTMHFDDDIVVVELSLNGTHKGDLPLPVGVIPPTGKEMHTPCCDVFHIEDGKVTRFHCHVAVPIMLSDLGVFQNLSAAVKK